MNLPRLSLPDAVNVYALPAQLNSREQTLKRFVPVALFILCFLVLLRTLCPTVYGLDSAEFATGAAILGIVHTPGYPLYVSVAHLFTLLPIGDVAFRVNLLSALCLALTAPVLYSLIYRLTRTRWIAVAASLSFIWSYYVWQSGTAAEIYAPQIFALAVCGWSLAGMYQEYQANGHASGRSALRTGICFGLAVAVATPCFLFAPGLALCFLLMRVPLRVCIVAGILSVLIVFSTLIYFPLRGAAYPAFNKIGVYDAQGVFHNFDFRTFSGVMEALSGEQFRYLFFANGYIPSLNTVLVTLSWLWRNYLGFGVLLGLVGMVYLFRGRRVLLLALLALALPYTYFFLCYGAVDRDTMFGPSYLVWSVLLAFGLQGLSRAVPNFPRYVVMAGLPLLALVANFSAVDLSRDTSVREHAEAVLDSLPPNAVAAGYWADVTPLQYLQFVEHKRPDVKIYDLFMFKSSSFNDYADHVSQSGRPIVLLNSAIVSVPDVPAQQVAFEPILTYLPGDARQHLLITLIKTIG
jgi:hypothetical protein